MALPDPRSVLAEFLPPETIRHIEPLDNAGGWSGSLIWRIQADQRTGLVAGLQASPVSGEGIPTSPMLYCLRRWPVGTDPQRLQFIHKVLTHVAAAGIDFVPAPLPLARRT